MLFDSPVPGVALRPDKAHYPKHPLAVRRPPGSHIPLVTHDFGPSTVEVEPTVDWRGGESDIFGRRIRAKLYDSFHKALDISRGGCVGDVLAAAEGDVIKSRKNSFGTELIVIDHGKQGDHHFKTRYAHLDPRIANVGDHVMPGDVIGRLGNSGEFSTGCHLHFAVTKDGRSVDPWRRLRQNTATDPDLPAPAVPVVPVIPVVVVPVEVPDVPIPASDDDYLAGQIALVGNETVGAQVRDGASSSAGLIRTIPGGFPEPWLPTCWVVGEMTFNSDRWLTRWFEGRWEFTHKVNVGSLEPIVAEVP